MMRTYKPGLDEQETILIFNMKDCCWEGKTNIPHHMTAFENAGWEMTYDHGHERAYRSPTTANPSKEQGVSGDGTDNLNTK